MTYLANTHGIADTVSPSWGDTWAMNSDGSNQHQITASAGHPTTGRNSRPEASLRELQPIRSSLGAFQSLPRASMSV
jgi:hypothetical protein